MNLEIENIKTKTNGFTLRINEYFLHSKYNPVKEAEQLAINHFKKIISIYCLVMDWGI